MRGGRLTSRPPFSLGWPRGASQATRLSGEAHPGPGQRKPDAVAELGYLGGAFFPHGQCQAKPAAFFHIQTMADHAQTLSQSVIVPRHSRHSGSVTIANFITTVPLESSYSTKDIFMGLRRKAQGRVKVLLSRWMSQISSSFACH
jgi:hypothetical protein